MTTHVVRATRWAHGWELDIPGYGITQSRGLADAEMMVRDYLGADIGEDAAAAAEVRIVPDLGGLEDAAAEVRAVNDSLVKATRDGAARAREVARRLLDAGLSGADAAVVLGISKQRMSQLRKDVDLARPSAPLRPGR